MNSTITILRHGWMRHEWLVSTPGYYDIAGVRRTHSGAWNAALAVAADREADPPMGYDDG